MVLKGVNWVHNDKIRSNGLESSQLGTQYKIRSYGLEGVGWVHNDKLGHMVLKGVIQVQNDKIRVKSS